MARKIQAALDTWVPWIVKAYQDNEELTTFAICKTIGRLLVSLEAHEQLEEINRVLDKLALDGYLMKMDDSKTAKTYWRVGFDSYAYNAADKISDLIKVVSKGSTKQTQHGAINNFHGNIAQVNIDSPGAVLSLQIKNSKVDKETKQLLEDLRSALQAKDRSKIKQALGYLANKGVDVVVQLVLGRFFSDM